MLSITLSSAIILLYLATELVSHDTEISPATKLVLSEPTNNRTFSGNCMLPDPILFNFHYNLTCPRIFSTASECENLNSSSKAPEFSTLSVNCFETYANEIDQETESICSKNRWRPALKPCKKICKKLKPEKSVNLECIYKGLSVNCTEDLRAGTKVLAKCFPGYQPESKNNTHDSEIVCHDDGEWSAALIACSSVCGHVQYINPLRTGNQFPILWSHLPWHVAIYDKKNTHPYDLICGGTIITEYMILSAAHCFYQNAGKDGMQDEENFEIAVAKNTRDRTIVDSENTQFYAVRKIFANNFHGVDLRYQNDIVILETEKQITFNINVIPACLHYTKHKISSSEILTVAGWGLDESDKVSSVLGFAQLGFLSLNECIKKAPPHLKPFLSNDKFCVSNITRSMVCRGDSGGGLFRKDKKTSRYYLLGIVSFKPTDSLSFAVATDVNYFMEWIKDVKDKIQQWHIWEGSLDS